MSKVQIPDTFRTMDRLTLEETAARLLECAKANRHDLEQILSLAGDMEDEPSMFHLMHDLVHGRMAATDSTIAESGVES